MAQRRIILHIGSPKCGSTFLQRAMMHNTVALSKAGAIYPRSPGKHPGNAADLATITHAKLNAMFAGRHTLILSHEDLYSMPKRGKALADLVAKDGTEVQVVVFLRPFPEIVFGDYSQYMKQFFEQFLASRDPYGGRTFKAFAHQRCTVLKPVMFLRGWQKHFPKNEIILSGNRTIATVFDRLLSPEAPLNWDVPRSQSNLSLRMEDCDRLAAAMRDPAVPDVTIRAMYQEALTKVEAHDRGRTKIRREMVDEIFKVQNEALRTHFNYDISVSNRI